MTDNYTHFEIRPCIDWDNGTMSYHSISEAAADMKDKLGYDRPIFWSLYGRTNHIDMINLWDCIADYTSLEQSMIITKRLGLKNVEIMQ